MQFYALLLRDIGAFIAYIYWKYQLFRIVSLFLTDKMFSRGLVSFSIFFNSKEWTKETVLSFV